MVPLATLVLSAALAGTPAPDVPSQPIAQASGETIKVDVPETVEVDIPAARVEERGTRTFLVVGLSTVAVVGLLLLIVLLARNTETQSHELNHHHSS